jgi:hypothetical protein
VLSASDYLTKQMSEQKGGSGSVTVLRPDGTQLPGSPFKGGGLPGPWAVVVDGNDNVWVSNFAMASSPIVQLCGVRTENCPPGFKTGDQISPPGGYVGGGLQLQTDIAVGPAGDVWAINNWQDIDSCYPGRPKRSPPAVVARVWSSFSAWPSRCVRRRSDRRSPSEASAFSCIESHHERRHGTPGCIVLPKPEES